MTHDSRTSSSRSGRKPLLWTGVTLLVAGVVLLAYLVWELYGTNVVAHRKQDAVVEQLTRTWATERGTQMNGKKPQAPAASSGETTAEQGNVPIGSASALVRIPRFGDGYVIPVLEGTSDAVLSVGFGHFTDTAGPGQPGNYALAAHRVTHGEPLRRMPELQPGDEVIVETRDAFYTYELDTDPNALVIPFSSAWVLEDLPDNPAPGGAEPPQVPGAAIITVTTCAELFHTDDRMIAFGHLVRTEPKN